MCGSILIHYDLLFSFVLHVRSNIGWCGCCWCTTGLFIKRWALFLQTTVSVCTSAITWSLRLMQLLLLSLIRIARQLLIVMMVAMLAWISASVVALPHGTLIGRLGPFWASSWGQLSWWSLVMSFMLVHRTWLLLTARVIMMDHCLVHCHASTNGWFQVDTRIIVLSCFIDLIAATLLLLWGCCQHWIALLSLTHRCWVRVSSYMMPLASRSHRRRLLMMIVSANLDIWGPEVVNIVPRCHHWRLLLLSLFRLCSSSTVSLPNKALWGVLRGHLLLIGRLLFGSRSSELLWLLSAVRGGETVVKFRSSARYHALSFLEPFVDWGFMSFALSDCVRYFGQ